MVAGTVSLLPGNIRYEGEEIQHKFTFLDTFVQELEDKRYLVGKGVDWNFGYT